MTLPLNHDYFSNLQDNNVLYWAGFLMADGCISNNNIILVLAEKDKKHVEQFKLDIGSGAKIQTNISKCSQRNPKWKDSICYRVSVCSTKMTADLSIFGVVSRKTFTCQFPDAIKKQTNVNNYCRGYFDGDGSIYISHPASRKSFSPYLMINIRGTQSFLNSFNEILVDKAGLPSKCLDKTTLDKSSKIGVIAYSGTPICTKITNWLYKDMDFNSRFLERKYNIVKDFIR
jgi:hypothetical protein